jgi:anti-sigma B factor antagonist
LLRISRCDYGDITALQLDGGMDMGNLRNRPSFREAIDDLIRNHRNKIILLYQGVRYQDSMGNGEIVSAFTRVRNAGGTLVFVGLPAKVREVFELTRLIVVFSVFNTLEEALSYLGYNSDSSNGTE